MNEEVNKETVTPENEVVTPPVNTGEVKVFKQEEVDNIVKGRLERERQQFAKTLGLEKYDDVKSFADSYNEIKSTLGAKDEALKTLEQTIESLQSDVIKHKLQIKDDKYKEALALAKIKQDGGLGMEEALAEVLKEYPSMKNGVTKVGEEAGRQELPNQPKYTKAFLQQFQHIPYYKGLLDQMTKGEK